MSVKRSVVFPDDINEVLNIEAKRQGASFNKVVVQACAEKYSSYDPDILNRADGGLREVHYEGDPSGYVKEIKLSGEDALRLEAFANEARLSETELVRRFARFGKVVINEVNIPGVDLWAEYSIPLIEDMQIIIERLMGNTANRSYLHELIIKTDELIRTMKLLRKNFFYTKRRFNNKLRKEGM